MLKIRKGIRYFFVYDSDLGLDIAEFDCYEQAELFIVNEFLPHREELTQLGEKPVTSTLGEVI